jgi:hypothetical protein
LIALSRLLVCLSFVRTTLDEDFLPTNKGAAWGFPFFFPLFVVAEIFPLRFLAPLPPLQEK